MQTTLKELDSFSKRLSYVIEKKEFKNPNEFGKELGYASSEKIFRLIRDKDNRPSSDILTDISNKFEDVNINWMLTGKGDPFFNLNVNPIVNLNVNPNVVSEPEKGYVKETRVGNMRVLAITVNEKQEEVIKFVPSMAQAGYLSGFNDPEYVAALPSISITGFLPQHGTYRTFEVGGDSMEPTFLPSDRLVGRYVEDYSYLRDNETYIVVCRNDGIVVKRLHNNFKEKFILCQSDNEVYPPYKVDYRDIIEIWKVFLVIRQNIIANSKVDKLIKELQKEVNLLKEKGK